MRNVFRQTAVVACLVAVCSFARAQEQPGASNPWAAVTRVNVHPGQVGEFEDYLKKIQAARTKIGLPHEAIVYQVALGGSPFTYHSLTPFTTWEQMDAFPSVPATLTKAYGEVEGTRILKAGRSAIADVTIEIYRFRLDLSTNAKPGAAPSPFVSLTVTEHHGEMLGTYLRLLGKIKKAEEQDANAPPVLRYVIVNGEAPITVAARPSATLAERAKWPNQTQVLRKVYGEGEQQDMGDTITKSIAKRSSVVLAYRPDLSKVSKP